MSREEVVLLRKQRSLAIANCEFMKAKLIDIHLKQLVEQSDDSDAAHQRMQNQLEYEHVKEFVRSDAQRAHSIAVEDMFKIESECQTRLAALLGQHTQVLAAHAESLAGDLELSAIRGVPDSITKTKAAQAVAKIGDFDLAESLFQESNDTRESAIQARQAEIKGVYDRLMEQSSAKYDEEVRLNQEKRAQRMRNVMLKYGKTTDKLRKQLVNAARKYNVERKEDEEEAFFIELANPEDGPPMPAMQPPSRSPSASAKSKADSGPLAKPPSRLPFASQGSPMGSYRTSPVR
jgi:hypothetical protein